MSEHHVTQFSAFYSCTTGPKFRKRCCLPLLYRLTDPGFFSPLSIPVTASLPPLEWPLCNQSGSYELRIEVQPKPHHRAHYETEGSRGAVKAPTGGHPVVQVQTPFLLLLCPMFVTGDSLLLSLSLLFVRLISVSASAFFSLSFL
jgi:hypothetical protein